MNNETVVAVMSHKRPQLFSDNTLKYLTDVQTNFKIHVFCSRAHDQAKYKKFFINHPLFAQLKFINAPDDYLEKCNMIYRYFKTDTNVFFMEDDVIELSFSRIGDNKLNKLINFDEFVHNSFSQCINQNCKIFGIYPVHNYYFMKNTVTTEFKFLIANAFGFISTKNNKKLILHSESKTDYERSVLYYLNYGGTMRFNYISAKTNNLKNKGGLNDDLVNRLESEALGVYYLLNMYPEYFKYKDYHSTPYDEIKTIKITPTDIYDELYHKLRGWDIPPNDRRSNVSGIAEVYCWPGDVAYNTWRYKGNPCQSITFGTVVPFMKPKEDLQDCVSNKNFPFYHKILKEYIRKIIPDKEFSHITVNRNLKCLPHKDKNNVGESTIFSFGDFTGGELNVSGVKHDIYKKPMTFNGCKEVHYTEPFEGDRFSIVVYNK